MQARTVYNMEEVIGKRIVRVVQRYGAIAIHFECGPPLLLLAHYDKELGPMISHTDVLINNDDALRYLGVFE